MNTIVKHGYIEVVTTYYHVGSAGFEVMRDASGNVLKINELAMWPFATAIPTVNAMEKTLRDHDLRTCGEIMDMLNEANDLPNIDVIKARIKEVYGP